MLRFTGVVVLALIVAVPVAAGDKLLFGTKERLPEVPGDNYVRHHGLLSEMPASTFIPLDRPRQWSLPTQALAPDFDTTIHCLVLRFNFLREDPDNPNTTGLGVMDLSPHPLPNEFNSATPEDSIEYLNRVGHFIDPPPHDSVYFDRHMRALNTYWQTVSEGRINLDWDIFPPAKDSVYQLPHEMSYYGRCGPEMNEIIKGLEYYFIDCIRLVDPDIDFSGYDAIFLIHAGSDRQNDIGFPPTCNDLYTGYIRFRHAVPVDGGARSVRTALLMPETCVQDNRATALNAALAHEFGHQLGLIDLYDTRNFVSLLGDFALMDHNGFGSGIDFDFPAGKVFGAIPVYPSAWSRAYLGFTPVIDVRRGDSVRIVAAEAESDAVKIVRVPISEKEYYLIENRNDTLKGGIYNDTIGTQFDTLTNVILGPARRDTDNFIVQTGEYDFLLPGSGMLIFHVDEAVAQLDYDGNGECNFINNHLQWDPSRKFVTLIEGDGLVNFGGIYQSGYGRAEDMFREDRNDAFTPITNPPAIDNSGNNTRVWLTGITRATDTTLPKRPYMDSVMYFDVETEKLVENFPVRVGVPAIGLSSIADDLNDDGVDEIIVASNRLLSVFTTTGDNFLRAIDPFDDSLIYYDTVITFVDTIGDPHTSFQTWPGYPVPLYVLAPDTISAGPVTGDFGMGGEKYVAIGYPTGDDSGKVVLYAPQDVDDDGRADTISAPILTIGKPVALSFGEVLWVLTDSGYVYRQDSLSVAPGAIYLLSEDDYHGICRAGNRLIVMGGTMFPYSYETRVYCLVDTLIYGFALTGRYNFGPIAVDMNLDNQPEIVAFSDDGDGFLLTVDTTSEAPNFSVLQQKATGFQMVVNPTAGDFDLDGYPDIIIGGQNTLYAFSAEMVLKTNFFVEVDDRHPDMDIITPVVVADIQGSEYPDLIFSNNAGNVYVYGEEGPAYGFPVSSGEQTAGYSDGAALVFHDSTGGKLGYLGGDGWFYAWEVDADTVHDFWPMGGASPSGTFAMDQSLLPEEREYVDNFPEDQFYNWPNPVVDGITHIRYFLGQPAGNVTLNIYDLSGERIATLDGTTVGGFDNEVLWDCSHVTPGVYRCVIEVDFDGDRKTAFTDIAVIR